MATASCSSFVDTASTLTNYARLGLATQVELPNILRVLLLIKEPPHFLEAHLTYHNYLLRNLRAHEWHNIRTVRLNQYKEFDVPLMYKIIRHLNLVEKPTQGWDNPTPPLSTEITVGDDIERIRRIRNEIVHRGNTNVQDSQLANYFSIFKDIAKRLEVTLMLSNKEFVSRIEHVETCCIDKDSEQHYIKRLKELEKYETELPVNLGEVFKDLVCRRSQMTGQVSKLQMIHNVTAEQEEAIPKHIRDQIKKEIDKWKQDDLKYVPTNASKYVINRLNDENCVTVVGSSGVGKTAATRHAALKMESMGYTVIPITVPTDIRDFYQPGRPTVFVIDNMCAYGIYKVPFSFGLGLIIDRRLEEEYRKLIETNSSDIEVKYEAYGIYKVPFSFGLELIIDRRLEEEYRKLIETNSSDIEVKYEDTYRYMVEFKNISELRKQNMNTMQAMNFLTDAIQRGEDLSVRWLLSNFDLENLIGDVFLKTLKINNMNMAKTLAWVITNQFLKKYKNNLCLQKIRIWPGFSCICNKKDALLICSNQFQIIIESLKIMKDIPCEFAGFNVRQLPYEKESKETSIITNCLSKHWDSEECCDNIYIPGKEAESLFDNHSNLSLISSSVIRSAGMPDKHKIEKVRCIQLHCTVKGVIPVGERHFPSFVCQYPTDVLEGCPLLATELKVGDRVGTLDPTGNFKSLGTLGGFMNHFGFECFLTCAHVVFDLQTLLGRVPNEIKSKGIDVFTSTTLANQPVHCGRVLRPLFDHDHKDETSIDAALICFAPSVTVDLKKIITDHFGFIRSMKELGLSSMDLNYICIDIASICHSKAELLCPGGFMKIKDTVEITPPTDYVDIQFSPHHNHAVSVHQGNAQPLMMATTAHMQLSTANLAGQRVFRMYNQLLLNLPLSLGDSGTCIYVTDKNRQRGCLGMAIGFLSSGQSIITPLREILKKL